jgi:hypothetical protein
MPCFNAQGLVCGCVNGTWKFAPHERVIYLESKRVKTHMMLGWINNAHDKWVRAIGFAKVQLCRLGRITLTVVFGVLGYVLVPTAPAPHVAQIVNWASTSIGMKSGSDITDRLMTRAELDGYCLALRLSFAGIWRKIEEFTDDFSLGVCTRE